MAKRAAGWQLWFVCGKQLMIFISISGDEYQWQRQRGFLTCTRFLTKGQTSLITKPKEN
jgi:hypothetical protein